MSRQEIETEIGKLNAENAAVLLKSTAVGTVGALVGLYLAYQQKKSNWGKFGYFVAGGAIARLPLTFLYADKVSQNLVKIDQLQKQLDTL